MRVTSTTTYLTMRDGLTSSLSLVAGLQEQLSSGHKIVRYSDDPSGAGAVLRYASEQSAQTSYQLAANDASARLGVTDTTLQSANSLLQRAQDLATGSVNGALGADARTANAQEIRQLRDQLVDMANTQHLGTSLFGGFSGTAVTQDPTTGVVTFTGDGGALNRQVGSDVTLQVNLPGTQVFGFDQPPGKDVFSVLQQLAIDVAAGNTAGIQTGSANLTVNGKTVLQALGTVGALTNRVEAATSTSNATSDRLTAQRSDLEDLDYADGVLRLSQAQTGYQAALAASAKANLPSLADFLK
ncbi:MAG: flagellar hook-associated protein 3 [Mycobacterium sp.]|nr:flagellar hook-associated protein 3 [Mycobacterium sp.]